MRTPISRFRLNEILNDQVRKALENDFELFLVFSQHFSGLDSDIDPTFNPDWCNRRKKEELVLLDQAQEALFTLRSRFSETTDQNK
jgi:hypothetical protein